MLLVNPQNKKKRDPHALLLLGPPGGGKSALMLQLPGIGVVDVDCNLDGPTNFLNKKLPGGVSYKYDNPTVMPNGKQATAEQVWPNILAITEQLIKDPDIKWVGVDGLTGLNFHLINYVMHRGGKKEMSQDLWIPFRQELLKFINLVRLAGKNYVMTCHEEWESSREGVVTRRKVSVDSKIAQYFGGWFTHVWRCIVEPAPGSNAKAKVFTRPTGPDDLKCSNPDMPPEISIDFTQPKCNINDLILKYLE